MAAANSPATGEAYGVRQVCVAWGMPRSSSTPPGRSPRRPPGRRRGPRPVVDDAGLLEAIRRDLDRSPFSGEGHRKVWARLRALDDIRVGRDRCCASCARMLCSRRTAARRGRPTTTTDASPPTRPA